MLSYMLQLNKTGIFHIIGCALKKEAKKDSLVEDFDGETKLRIG